MSYLCELGSCIDDCDLVAVRLQSQSCREAAQAGADNENVQGSGCVSHVVILSERKFSGLWLSPGLLK